MIYSQFIVRFNRELGAAFGFVLLGPSSFIVWAALRLSGQALEKTMGWAMIPTIKQSALLRASCNAFLFNRHTFRFSGVLYPMMLLPLVVPGQFSFITTIGTLVIAARLKPFDASLEEAALNLGASHMAAVWTITRPFLRPATIGASVVAFLMSFEDFNSTLMLVGSDAPLTITMFDRLKDGSTPALNAVSLLLMIGSSFLALMMIAYQK